jgi:hypothetical protein
VPDLSALEWANTTTRPPKQKEELGIVIFGDSDEDWVFTACQLSVLIEVCAVKQASETPHGRQCCMVSVLIGDRPSVPSSCYCFHHK